MILLRLIFFLFFDIKKKCLKKNCRVRTKELHKGPFKYCVSKEEGGWSQIYNTLY